MRRRTGKEVGSLWLGECVIERHSRCSRLLVYFSLSQDRGCLMKRETTAPELQSRSGFDRPHMEIHRWTESIHILFTKTCRTNYHVLPALDANSLIAGLPHLIIRSGSTTALTVARCEGRGGNAVDAVPWGLRTQWTLVYVVFALVTASRGSPR